MKSIRTRILFCALPLVIAALTASAAPAGLVQVAEQPAAQDPHREFLQALADAARSHHVRHRAAHHVPRVRVRESEPDADFARTHATPRPVAAKPAVRGETGAIRRAEARETAERAARVEDLYRVSQTSAPIIANATACKRIGVHGESIYENCGTMVAAGADGSR
jgi:hypothetical protein